MSPQEKESADLGQQVSRLLAVDQASSTSGFAVFVDGELTDYGKFTFSESDIAERLVNIREKVISLIDLFQIDEVAFEDIQMQNNVNNVQTFKVLAEVFGVILELLQEKKIKYTIVPSSTWKSTLNIKGKTRTEQKKNAQNFVLEKYNIKAIQDTCDAICIGTHILNHGGHLQETNGFDWSK